MGAAGPPGQPGTGERRFVLFDVDGTLLDSADGIVAGIAHALRSVDVRPPPEEVLRADIGPPLAEVFTGLGLRAEQVEMAVQSYRLYYRTRGVDQAQIYPGILEALRTLHTTAVLATATSKRIEMAGLFLRRHRLDRYFSLIGGGSDQQLSKADIVADTCRRLGSPPPEQVVMVGDRSSDVLSGRALGLRTIGVGWGYGSGDELREACPDLLLERAAELPRAIRTLLSTS